MPLTLSGTNGVQDNVGAFVQGTQVASTSGTAIDFTSIPSWVKRIQVCLTNVSTSGTGNPLIRLGTSSGVQTTGYIGGCQASGGTYQNLTGFLIFPAWAASYNMYTVATIVNMGSNMWNVQGTSVLATTAANYALYAGGVTLSGTLDRIRVTTDNGTDTFDAGSINIVYD